jgi:4-aminobutyrate aminotransferase-like enzyme
LDFEAGRAKGAVVEDRSGRQYIDCVGGYGNLNVGHNHPHVVEAMVRALEAGRPFGWPFISEAHAQLAERLAELAPAGLECCLIVNSGAEAVDSVLKLVRLATAHGTGSLWAPSVFQSLKCAGASGRFCRECGECLSAKRAPRRK